MSTSLRTERSPNAIGVLGRVKLAAEHPANVLRAPARTSVLLPRAAGHSGNHRSLSRSRIPRPLQLNGVAPHPGLRRTAAACRNRDCSTPPSGSVPQIKLERKRGGQSPCCRNGRQGAAHKRGLSAFSLSVCYFDSVTVSLERAIPPGPLSVALRNSGTELNCEAFYIMFYGAYGILSCRLIPQAVRTVALAVSASLRTCNRER